MTGLAALLAIIICLSATLPLLVQSQTKLKLLESDNQLEEIILRGRGLGKLNEKRN